MIKTMGVLVTVGPWFPDILQRHRVVVPELRVRAPLDYAPSNLDFRVGINKVDHGNRNAGVAQRVFAFQRTSLSADEQKVTFAAYPNGRTVRRAIGHDCRKVSEVRTVDQLLHIVGERNSHRASFAQIVRSMFARLRERTRFIPTTGLTETGSRRNDQELPDVFVRPA